VSLGAVALAAIAVAVAVGAAGFLLVPVRPGATHANVSPLQVLPDVVFLGITPVLGAYLTRYPQGRTVGWLFVQMSFWLSLGFLSDGVARHLPASPAVGWAAALMNNLGSLAFVVLFLLLQLFPTGRYPSPGWRWTGVLAVVVGVVQSAASLLAGQALNPPIPDLPLPAFPPEVRATAGAVEGGASILTIIVLVGSIALLASRFRSARGTQRQQLKWFVWAGSVVALLLTASVASAPLGSVSDALWTLALAAIVLLPISATLAIVRYRLWDIDRIVSRTLGYTALSVLLAATFVVVNLGLQEVLSSITQAGTLSSALSTLAVFGLFQPLRSRIQAIVDRRFDRARVDAEHAVTRFADRLRDEVELETIAEETQGVVEQTLHPASMGLWVRGHGEPSGAPGGNVGRARSSAQPAGVTAPRAASLVCRPRPRSIPLRSRQVAGRNR
jgi:hypothetical protein